MPTDQQPIRCTHCGRPLRTATSRVLRLGDRCRLGMTEAELTANLQGAAV